MDIVISSRWNFFKFSEEEKHLNLFLKGTAQAVDDFLSFLFLIGGAIAGIKTPDTAAAMARLAFLWRIPQALQRDCRNRKDKG